MLILIAIALSLIPAAAILYPFLFRRGDAGAVEDETAAHADLARRWEAAVASLRTAELERVIGNLSEPDYRELRETYMLDAAAVVKEMDLQERQEEELFNSIASEVRQVRERFEGEALPCESERGGDDG